MKTNDASIILCPKCGFDHAHPVELECRPAGGHGNGLVRITHAGIFQNPETPAPACRGVRISLKFFCEGCRKTFTYALQFHEGRTRVELAELATPPVEPTTIWRD